MCFQIYEVFHLDSTSLYIQLVGDDRLDVKPPFTWKNVGIGDDDNQVEHQALGSGFKLKIYARRFSCLLVF